MAPHDDELDRRFRDLIRAEFGDVAGTRGPDDPAAPPFAAPPATAPSRPRFRSRQRDPIEYFNLGSAIEHATPDEPFERWDPPAAGRLARPPRRVLLGVGLLAVSMVVSVVVLAGGRPAQPVGVWTMLVAGAGLALLLSALPRRRPIDGDGAQL